MSEIICKIQYAVLKNTKTAKLGKAGQVFQALKEGSCPE